MSITRESFIANLTRHYDVDPADAERQWQRYAAKNAPKPPAVVSEPENLEQLEKDTQREVSKLFVAFGGDVWPTSQSRATKMRPGFPDLWVFFARCGIALWWETKRPKGGRFSDAQREFAHLCDVTRVHWGGGSRADAEAWLIAHGIAERTPDGTLEPRRAAA